MSDGRHAGVVDKELQIIRGELAYKGVKYSYTIVRKRCKKWFENYRWRDATIYTNYLPEYENYTPCMTRMCANTTVFDDVTPCRLVTNYHPSEVSSCLHLQDEAVFPSRLLIPECQTTVTLKRRSTQHNIRENLKCQQHRCQNHKSRTSNIVFHDFRMTGPWTVTSHRQGIPQRAENSWTTQTYTFIVTAFQVPKTSDFLGPWT